MAVHEAVNRRTPQRAEFVETASPRDSPSPAHRHPPHLPTRERGAKVYYAMSSTKPIPRPRNPHRASRFTLVTFHARFSKTYKRNPPRFSMPIRAYTGLVSPCAISRKTAQIANHPNTCPPRKLQASAQTFFAYCHLGFYAVGQAKRRRIKMKWKRFPIAVHVRTDSRTNCAGRREEERLGAGAGLTA